MFFSEILKGGGCIQLCTKYKGIVCTKDLDILQEAINNNQSQDLYFVSGVEETLGTKRASDSDIKLKNNFYIDIDVRKEYPSVTDEELRGDFLEGMKATLEISEEFSQYRHIICSGNGYQIHYMTNNPVALFHGDVQSWAEGLRNVYARMSEAIKMDIPLDNSCVNLSRLARVPGSLNHKSSPPKQAELLYSTDYWYEGFDTILSTGKAIVDKKKEKKQTTAMQIQERQTTTGMSAYDRIGITSIADVVCRLLGWTTVVDGGKTYFLAPGAEKRSACYVQDGENFLIHGGTHEFSDYGMRGFSPFMFVKMVGSKSNAQVFDWFKKEFHVEGDDYGSRNNGSNASLPEVKTSSITDIFSKLQNVDFSLLKMENTLDAYDLLMRKIVLRIGALSYTGKSKVGYWLVNRLCKTGYEGYVFSTEVTSERVLAELIHQVHPTSFDPKEILRGEVEVTDNMLETFKKLHIYDSVTTDNTLEKIESLISHGYERAKKEGIHPPAFALIDFVQMIVPKGGVTDDYRAASQYASQIQTIAQKYEICIIDLSQLNADGMKDTHQDQGYIPFMNSRALYSNADIAVMLKRDRSDVNCANHTTFSIRKHKYGEPADVVLEYSHKNGMFKEVEEIDQKW